MIFTCFRHKTLAKKGTDNFFLYFLKSPIINARVFNKIAGKPCAFIFMNQYDNLYINNLSVFQQTLIIPIVRRRLCVVYGKIICDRSKGLYRTRIISK